VDYQGDVPTSPEIIRKFGDKYRKIRNTLRYLLSNLYDFDAAAATAALPPSSLDAWALAQLDTLIGDVTAAYDAYQLHVAFRLLHDFCAVQISAMYGNASKDRLYCEKSDSPLRRRCQSVMQQMALALTKLLAPMIVFTADEVWEHLPKDADDAKLSSVHLALLPKPSALQPTPQQQEDWALLMSLRENLLGQLDTLTRQIGKYKALDAEVVFETSRPELRSRLQAFGPDLEDIVSAGFHRWSDASGSGDPSVAVRVTLVDTRDRPGYASCARCWKRRPDVGSDPQKPDLCRRCAAVV
jgi:isoleucyl-tRNA synthetase